MDYQVIIYPSVFIAFINFVESESGVPKTLQSAKCSVPKVEKDVTIPSGS